MMVSEMKKILALLLCLLPSLASAQIVGTLPFQLQNGTTADATQVMADFNKILTDINANAAKNGINSDITALTALITPITPSVGGSTVYYASTSSGTANAQIVASSAPSGFTLSVGKRVTFIAGFTNTAAMTLNVNSTGATNVFRYTPSGPIALTGGEVIAGNYIEAVFDGTRFQLYTNASTPVFGPVTTIASATTTDLGTIPSHNAVITGATTITSFGSSAVTTYPVYKLKFAGVLTLTNNITSLILPGGISITTALGDTADALYLGSGNWQITSYNRLNGQPVAFNAIFLQDYISGLTMSTAGGSTTMTTSTGVAADNTAAVMMVLPSPLAKTTASWAVGTATGGLDTGSIAANTWYHFYAIQRPDTGVVDVVFSLSPTSPTLPTNYTRFRRIYSAKTNGSSQWILVRQTGDEFIWDIAVQDVNGATPGATALHTLASIPTGITVTAKGQVALTATAAGSTLLLQTGTNSSATAGVPGGNLTLVSANNGTIASNVALMTNTAAQIRSQGSGTSTPTWFFVTTGWTDTRGKS